jgi:hypothetical protein
MKLKTSPIQILERGLPTENSCDIFLSGTEQVCEYFPELRYQKNPPCSSTNSFIVAFGLDNKFYYRLEKYNQKQVIDLEIGIGHLVQEAPDIILLRRSQPLLYKHGSEPIAPVERPVNAFACNNQDDYLIVHSYHAHSLPELLVDPHSLIVSIPDNPVNIVNVEENSLIGRLDGNVTSLSISDICNKAANLLIDCTKQIILSCSQLDVKKLKTKILQLTPTKPAQAKKGSIIYNEEHDTIQYFDGSRWRTLLWRFEDE